MARKRLIKGANATRVEERIARVPEDIETESNIFRALKALEGAQSVSPLPPRSSKPRAKIAPQPKTGNSRKARIEKKLGPSGGQLEERTELRARPMAAENRFPVSTPQAAAAAFAVEPSKDKKPPKRIGPSDFSAAERAAIVRCCADYRNRLPIYLLAVQKEVEIIDSVIEKCGRVDEGKRKS